jgi:hypothetical protein
VKRLALTLAFLLGSVAFAQVPPAVPALPDTSRISAYTLAGTTCACSVGFGIYADNASTDIDNWVQVWISSAAGATATRYLSTDPVFGWAITSPTGSLALIPRPITDAVLTFNSLQTGYVVILGAARPRRNNEFVENRGVPARDHNQVLNTVFAELRETWDKLNGAIIGQPGEVLARLPSASTRALQNLIFDANGNPTVSSNIGNTFANVTVTGSFTATGLVTNADLVNAATTVNGQTCTLGSTCTVAAAVSTLTGAGTGVDTALANAVNAAGGMVLYSGALGTPTSGVGTNLTGLNASNLSSGTVAVARLPVATTSALGVVEPDGTTITISGGVISSAASGITALTGDVTATGPGSAAATLASVNGGSGSVGSSTAIPVLTTNAKGLVTAQTTAAVVAPASTLTGTALPAGITTASGLVTVGTIGTGVWQGTVVGATYGGTGVNNGAKTITLGASLTTTGAGAPTLAFPASGATYTYPAGTATLASLTTADQTLSGGANVTSAGNTTGNITVDCGKAPLQYIANNGAWQITAPSNDGSCMFMVRNGASAALPTYSGFTVPSGTTQPTTVNGSLFTLSVWRITDATGAVSGYSWFAHQ